MPIRRFASLIRCTRPGGLLAACILLGACEIQRTPRAEVVNPDSARATEIEASLEGYRNALLERDPRRSAAFFTPDARLYTPGAPPLEGNDRIRGMLQYALDSTEVTSLTMDREIIDIAGDSTAYEIGTFEQSYREEGADGGEELTVEGKYMIRWRLEPQAIWRIHTMLLNHTAVPDSAAVDSAAVDTAAGA